MSSEKFQWVEQAQVLRQRVQTLEREKVNSFYCTKGELSKDACALQEEERLETTERIAHKATLFEKLKEAKTTVAKLRQCLFFAGVGPSYMQKLQEMMDSADQQIASFKKEQKIIYDDLMRQEFTLSKEIAQTAESFDNWNRQEEIPVPSTAHANTHSNRAGPSNLYPKTFSMPAEVEAVEALLRQEGGITGGWDERDHEMFLRFRTQYPNQTDAMLRHCVAEIPNMTLDMAREHQEWYERYLVLLQRKRDAVRQWRGSKLNKHQEATEEAHSSDGQSQRGTSPVLRSTLSARERERKRAELEAWKEQKRRAVEEAAAAEQAQAEEEKARQAREWEERKRAKQLLEAHLAEKRQQDNNVARPMTGRPASPMFTPRAATPRSAVGTPRGGGTPRSKELMSRAERGLEKARELAQAREAKLREQAEKQSKGSALKKAVDSSVCRDPSRLTRPTVSSQQRNLPPEDGDGASSGAMGYNVLLGHQTKAIPAWRAQPS